jgi:hypothetical protein
MEIRQGGCNPLLISVCVSEVSKYIYIYTYIYTYIYVCVCVCVCVCV